MRYPSASASLAYRYPVPYRTHWGYIWFWRVLSLAVLLWALGMTLWETRTMWGRREATLVGLVALQVVLYLKTFLCTQVWPPAWRWRIGYSLGSAVLCWLTWRLEARFVIMWGVYCGHLYVLLPPRVAVPATALLLGLSVGLESGWDVSRVAWAQQMERVLPWTALAVLFSYMYHANHASRERARLIAELQAAQRDLEVARQRHAELAALQERERLARDLHDSLGHTLVTLSIQLEAMQRLYPVDPERASAQVDAMKTLTRTSMAELRRALEGLRTPGLGDRSLSQALLALALEVGQRTGIAVHCQVAEGVEPVGPTVAEALWRVAQEALTNVVKHAWAHCVEVCLERTSQMLVLRVIDDGCGLPPDAASRSGHYGLRGMRERLAGLGGTLRLDSDVQRGTTVEARVPLVAAGRGPAAGRDLLAGDQPA